MRIVLVSDSLRLGGAERVLAWLAGAWDGVGHEVSIVTFDKVEGDHFPLASGVRRIGLDLRRPSVSWAGAAAMNSRRRRELHRQLAALGPDVVLSFQDATNVTTLLAVKRLGISVVVAERTDPRQKAIPWPWRLARRIYYPRACEVIVQTESVGAWMAPRVAPVPVTVIPNAVSPVQEEQGAPRDRTIVGLGRLVPEKGFDLLVQAFAQCRAAREWELRICGEGPERSRLEGLAEQEGVAAQTSLPGAVSTPAGLLTRAGIFVLPSRREGFPNALLEAMAAGAPVVAADCPSGPGEILTHDTDGLLVPANDVSALAAALDRLVSEEETRRRLGTAARTSVQRFAPDRILARWNEVLARAVGEEP